MVASASDSPFIILVDWRQCGCTHHNFNIGVLNLRDDLRGVGCWLGTTDRSRGKGGPEVFTALFTFFKNSIMYLRAAAIIVAVLLGSADLCGSLSCTEDLSPVFGQRGEFTPCVFITANFSCF
jgi:hypothetical protein